MNDLGAAEKYMYSFEQSYQGYSMYKHLDPRLYREMKRVLERVRRFCQEEAAPMALRLDREMIRDPENKELLWDFIRMAGREGLFTNMIPKAYGGGGVPICLSTIVLEELSATCLGMANVVGAHWLGYFTMWLSFRFGLTNRISREIIEAERSDKPVLMSLAACEPMVGSDMMDPDLYPSATTNSSAKRVNGGYVLNGAKCFISDGSISKYTCAIIPFDRKRFLETFSAFLIPTDSEGFSFGKDFHKMGQKSCPASELHFEDIFVPEEYRLFPNVEPFVPVAAIMGEFLGFTRVCIGAFGVGAARGAYEKAVCYARQTRVRGKLLINHQWAQMILSRMLINVIQARTLVEEAVFGDLQWGLHKYLLPRTRHGYRWYRLAELAMRTPVAKWGSNLSHNFLNSTMMEKSGDRPGRIVRWVIEHVGMDPMHARVFASTAVRSKAAWPVDFLTWTGY